MGEDAPGMNTTKLNIAVGLPGTHYSKCPIINAQQRTASSGKAELTLRVQYGGQEACCPAVEGPGACGMHSGSHVEWTDAASMSLPPQVDDCG